MAWFALLLAGFLEVGWAIGLKYTDGFTRLIPTVLTVGSMVLSVALLGIVLFAEPAGIVRLGCISLIVAGIAGLKLAA